MTLRSLSSLLADDLNQLPNTTLSIKAILDLFHERGFGFFLLLFALPMALPIPVPPGINILLASPLLFLTLQQMLGFKRIWLPSFISKKTINGSDFKATMQKALPFIQKFEYLIRPRFAFMTAGLVSNFIGFCGVIFTLFIMIPLPLTNTIPSFAISLMAIGVIMRDGLCVYLGMVIGFCWTTLLSWALITYGMDGFDIIKEWIKSLV